MRPTVFEPRALPGEVARTMRGRLASAHRSEPFSTVDPRATVRRVTALLEGLPLRAVVYRGGVDLRGSEVDHVWLALQYEGVGDKGSGPYVLDAAFPLFSDDFVRALRRFVAGDATPEELETIGGRSGVERRVVGEFPAPLRYLGRPVWTSAH